ncbi:MAG TPA: ABC transporter ATP-binding protein, partial [Vulgatibacter sp.]
TMIGCVSGLVIPTAGTATVLGWDTRRDYRLTRQAVGLVPQELNYDPFFTVEETLRFQAGYFGVKLEERKLAEILDALDLTRKRKSGTRELSGGMKRRLLIGKALVHDPKVLFLDEPTAGVDVELRRDLWAYVRRLREQGTTIVLTTHYLEEAQELADRVGMIDRGRLLLVEEKARLLARLGHKTLVLTLRQPIAGLPEALSAAGAVLKEGGRVVEITRPVEAELGPMVSLAVSAGLDLLDVDTRRTDLEEIYVQLLAKGEGGAP